MESALSFMKRATGQITHPLPSGKYRSNRSDSRRLMALGLGAGERVSLISEGRTTGCWVSWVCSTPGSAVPLSVKLETVQDITFRVNHSDSVMVLASDQQITKLRPMKELFTTVKRYILLDPVEEVADDEIYFDKVLELGDALLTADRKQVEERMAAVEPDSLANIIYTSGTTANPKGIMLSHDNYVCNVEQAVDHLNGIPSYFRTLLILPWDHSFGHTAGIYAFMKCGAAIASVAAGKSAMEILRNGPKHEGDQPHLLMSVPALATNFGRTSRRGLRSRAKPPGVSSAGTEGGLCLQR